MASKENVEIPEKILCAPVKSVMSKESDVTIASVEETAKEIDIGTPERSNIKSVTRIINPAVKAILIFNHPFFICFIKLYIFVIL